MKRITTTILMLLATGFAFGQSFELIKTKKILVSNMAVGQRYDFKLYNDSLVKTITGGLGTGKIVGTPEGSTTYIAKQTTVTAGSTIHTYQTADTRITIVKAKSRRVITIEVKDSFTNEVNKIMHF